ncbi:MAG: hypothetical protein WCI36_03760 [bacterium]
MKKTTKGNVAVIAIIIVIVAVTVGVIGWMFMKKFQPSDQKVSTNQIQELKNQTTQIAKEIPSIEVPAGWKLYKHDVLGIEFIYPASWGEPHTAPLTNITNLQGIESDFEKQNTAYYNNVSISFENNNIIQLVVFNDKFSGIESPYGDPMDNVSDLKKSGNICDYKLGYSNANGDTIHEIVDTCQQGVKDILTEEKQVFDFGDNKNKPVYSYAFKNFGYHTLSNGYFNQVLVEADFGAIVQIKNKISSIEEFYNNSERRGAQDKALTKDEIENQKNQLSKLVSSIQSFAPSAKSSIDFETIAGEDSNITAIRKYYWLISTGKLQDAYAMYASNKISFDTFQQWYGNVFFAKPSDFKKITGNQYEFSVQYQESNADPTQYDVVMNVVGGKIETMSSREILSEPSIFGNTKVSAVKRNNKNYVVLEKDGSETIIDQAVAEYDKDYKNIGEVRFFSNVKFSPRGNFVIYNVGAWEWGGTSVYDIAKKKIVFTQGAAREVTFTDDEKNVFTCAASAFDGTFDGIVFASNNFDNPLFDISKYDSEASKNYQSITCDLDNGTVIFKLTDPWGDSVKQKEKTITFSLSQNKVIK